MEIVSPVYMGIIRPKNIIFGGYWGLICILCPMNLIRLQ